MTTDFTAYPFVEGKTYAVEVEPGTNSVQVAHHGEGQLEPQQRYGMLEFVAPIGSGPWRSFRDWESEAEVTIDAHHIDAHHIVSVEERSES